MNNTTFMAAAAAVAFSVSALAPAQSLTTLFAADNGGSPGGAVYFDLQVSVPVELSSIDVNTSAFGTPGGVELYLSCASDWRAPDHLHPSKWKLIGNATGTAAGVDQPTACQFGSPLHFSPGSYRVALVLNGWDHSYTNGSATYGNSDLSLDLGGATNIPFTGVQYAPRTWNGTLHYTKTPTTAAIVPPVPCSYLAKVEPYGESSAGVPGGDLVLDSSEPLLGATLELRHNALPSQQLSATVLSLERHSVPLDNLLWQAGPSLVGSFVVPTIPDAYGLTRFAFQLPNDQQLLGVPLHWQTFALEPSQGPIPAVYSNGLTTTVGDRAVGAEVGLEIDEDVDLQALVPCPLGQRRYIVRGWRRNTVGPGVQSVDVSHGGLVIARESLAPGCLIGKLWTDRFVGCLPVDPNLVLGYQDCQDRPIQIAIAGWAIGIIGCPGAPVALPRVGLLAVAGGWTGTWSSSRPVVASINQGGNWIAHSSGKTKVTFSGFQNVGNERVHISTSCWIRVQ